MKHLVTNYDGNFAGLYSALLEKKEMGYVTARPASFSKNLEIWNYTNNCVYEKGWDTVTLIARGLIVDTNEQRVVAYGFPKFFNYGEIEGTTSLPDEKFVVTEKMDGSLGIVFFYDGEWRVSTRGSFDSEQAVWGNSWLNENVDLTKLVPGTTYLVEIIASQYRIVVNYDFEGLVLLSAYDKDGEEWSYNRLMKFAEETEGFSVTEKREFESVNDIVELCKTLPESDEGFVVRYESGLRVKVKGDAYCRLHSLISACTPLSVWKMMYNGDDLEEYAKLLPEEYRRDFYKIWELLKEKTDKRWKKLEELHEATKDKDNKTIGLGLNELTHIYGNVAEFLFSYRNGKTNTEKFRRSWYRSFRPTGNYLEGYTASTVVNRFKEEE